MNATSSLVSRPGTGSTLLSTPSRGTAWHGSAASSAVQRNRSWSNTYVGCWSDQLYTENPEALGQVAHGELVHLERDLHVRVRRVVPPVTEHAVDGNARAQRRSGGDLGLLV